MSKASVVMATRRSAGPSGSRARNARSSAATAPCETVTALGRPVEPDVKMVYAAAVGGTSHGWPALAPALAGHSTAGSATSSSATSSSPTGASTSARTAAARSAGEPPEPGRLSVTMARTPASRTIERSRCGG
jgi:hypothetical protein